MPKIKHLIWFFIFIIADLAVYAFLGIGLMHYDDFHDESKGEYWSWASMTLTDKLWVIGIDFWHLVNAIVIGYLIYRFIKGLMHTGITNNYKENEDFKGI